MFQFAISDILIYIHLLIFSVSLSVIIKNIYLFIYVEVWINLLIYTYNLYYVK
jgi:hypothetical protein